MLVEFEIADVLKPDTLYLKPDTVKPEYRRLNHVTINVPAGEHDKVRAFYGGTLGLKEIPSLSALAGIYDLL